MQTFLRNTYRQNKDKISAKNKRNIIGIFVRALNKYRESTIKSSFSQIKMMAMPDASLVALKEVRFHL